MDHTTTLGVGKPIQAKSTSSTSTRFFKTFALNERESALSATYNLQRITSGALYSVATNSLSSVPKKKRTSLFRFQFPYSYARTLGSTCTTKATTTINSSSSSSKSSLHSSNCVDCEENKDSYQQKHHTTDALAPAPAENQQTFLPQRKEIKDIDELTRTWREIPALNPILEFPSWKVPLTTLQSLMKSPLVQPYLISRLSLFDHVPPHRRMKTIQSNPNETKNITTNDDDNKVLSNDEYGYDRGQVYKFILLHPQVPDFDKLPNNVQKLLEDAQVVISDQTTFKQQLRPCDFVASFILETVLPKEVHPPPAAFETIGHVAHLNLRSLHEPYRYLIGQVFLEALPTIRTVIHKVGQVSGPYRTYPYEVVAERQVPSSTTSKENKEDISLPGTNTTKNGTVVTFYEAGVSLKFDVRKVYWSSRLSRERRRLIADEFSESQWIADAFCGVGALCLQAALKKNCRITANDWNPEAIAALKQNAERNNLNNSFYEIICGDAYEFLASLGLGRGDQGTDPSFARRPKHLPHHVILNFPLKAASFLGALRWWPATEGVSMRNLNDSTREKEVTPRVHVYTFAKESSNCDSGHVSNGTSVEELAVEEIASHLLPMPSRTMTRWQELNDIFGCNVKVHNVRDVAPGKVVLCVSFSATKSLLRYMQGYF